MHPRPTRPSDQIEGKEKVASSRHAKVGTSFQASRACRTPAHQVDIVLPTLVSSTCTFMPMRGVATSAHEKDEGLGQCDCRRRSFRTFSRFFLSRSLRRAHRHPLRVGSRRTPLRLRQSFRTLSSFTLAHATECSVAGRYLARGRVLPLVDGQRANSKQLASLGGGKPQALAVLRETLGAPSIAGRSRLNRKPKAESRSYDLSPYHAASPTQASAAQAGLRLAGRPRRACCRPDHARRPCASRPVCCRAGQARPRSRSRHAQQPRRGRLAAARPICT